MNVNQQLSSDVKSKQSGIELHRILTHDQLCELRNDFGKSPTNSLTEDKLHALLQNKYNICMDDDKFHILFQHIDDNGDGDCDWNEFVSYLMVLFNVDDPNNLSDTLNLPIEDSPMQYRSNHMYPVNRIRYCPSISTDGTMNHKNGIYLTSSKDGTLNIWDNEFQLMRTEKSSSPTLKVNKTWILNFLFIVDLQIICTSSIECDLRFYDTRANGFQLRLIISQFPSAINAMSYWFPLMGDNVNCLPISRIILGDFDGNVILLSFNANENGLFENIGSSNVEYVNTLWMDVLQRLQLTHIQVQVFENIHSQMVTQVEYNHNTNSLYSSSEIDMAAVNSKYDSGLTITDLGPSNSKIIIRMPKGVTCFAIGDAMLVATGGPDTILRLWNNAIPEKPTAIFPGHNAGLIYVFLQDECKRIYSFDKSKILKVWSVQKETLLQTCNMFTTIIMDRCFLTAFYNDSSRELIIGGMQINVLICCPVLDLDMTDGYTHNQTVSVALYNKLFNTIVTCGFDSSIINWNLANGERLTFIKEAHTMSFYGETVSVEITAACFNPNRHFLLTGAGNGTIKIWNFNSGICIRNVSLDDKKEVTAVHWLPLKILVAGWNRCITEFSVSMERPQGFNWPKNHNEDIVSCAISGQTIATGSFSGELILWHLDTGHPYRKCFVHNPTEHINISRGDGNNKPKQAERQYLKSLLKKKQKSKLPQVGGAATKVKRELSVVPLPENALAFTNTTVDAMLFLHTRKLSPNHGTLALALSNGIIQFYSHHEQGTYIAEFNAIHMAGDCIVALATNEKNEYLFTGTAFGYIKTWLIVNYCVPVDEQIHVNLPKLRLEFPFLINDLWDGRAKRSARSFSNPMLINSYKAHIRSVCSMEYIDEYKILISSSSDCTVRLWTAGGRYIQTMGSSIKHDNLIKNITEKNVQFRYPPDIKNCASSTTLKVLSGATGMDAFEMLKMFQNESQTMRESVQENDSEEEQWNKNGVERGRLSAPILGKNFELTTRNAIRGKPVISQEYPFIPIYKHFSIKKSEIMTDLSSKPNRQFS